MSEQELKDDHAHAEGEECPGCAKVYGFIGALEVMVQMNASMNNLHPHDVLTALGYVMWNIAYNTVTPGSDHDALMRHIVEQGKAIYLANVAEQRKAADKAAQEAGETAPAGMRTN